jgi:hypothetical protein
LTITRNCLSTAVGALAEGAAANPPSSMFATAHAALRSSTTDSCSTLSQAAAGTPPPSSAIVTDIDIETQRTDEWTDGNPSKALLIL